MVMQEVRNQVVSNDEKSFYGYVKFMKTRYLIFKGR